MFGAIVSARHPGAMYLSQSLEFRRPMFLGDTVTATVTVNQARKAGRVLDFATACENQRGELVLSGSARVLLPRLRGASPEEQTLQRHAHGPSHQHDPGP